MSLSTSPSAAATTSRRDKLGLALAGGGFRASLFHLGVLRRMAELDLLRHVETISCVSGGSIVGALYVLLLKERLDANASLTREEYIDLVKELKKSLVKAIQKNLRVWLAMNPLGILRVLLTEHSLGKRMSRLYERYLYADAVRRLTPNARPSLWRPGRIALKDVRFQPGGKRLSQGLEAYNADPGHVSKVPNLILNATSLNSGQPFRFSSVEIGDPRLGYFRYDEIRSELAPRKQWLQTIARDELERKAKANPGDEPLVYAAWWRSCRDGLESPVMPSVLKTLPALPGPLADAELGALRRAKIPAWYMLRGPKQDPPVNGGVPRAVHVARFWDALSDIDEDFGAALRERIEAGSTLEGQLLELVLELYYLRSAEVMSPRLGRHFEALALSEAVGASACFPPVFPPFLVLGIYDDLVVSRLGLTDGGVYDNVGLTALGDENCTHIIASDTSGLFDVAQRVSSGRVGMAVRIPGILMDDVAGLQRTSLREHRRVSAAVAGSVGDPARLCASFDLRGLAFFHINSRPLPGAGLDLGLDRESLGRVRTDLDAFGDVEVAALVNHGYDTADRYLRKYLDGSPFAKAAYWTPATAPPVAMAAPASRVRRILAAAPSRAFRALKLGSIVSWAFTVAVVGGLVAATWSTRWSAADVVAGLASLVIVWIGAIPWLGPLMVDWSVSIGAAILALVVGAAVAMEVWPWVTKRFAHHHPRLLRGIASSVKWIRSYLGNLLWLFGLTPLWIALGGAALAWISYLFYSRPFLAKTALPREDR